LGWWVFVLTLGGEKAYLVGAEEALVECSCQAGVLKIRRKGVVVDI
jgi:hypothetical protein